MDIDETVAVKRMWLNASSITGDDTLGRFKEETRSLVRTIGSSTSSHILKVLPRCEQTTCISLTITTISSGVGISFLDDE